MSNRKGWLYALNEKGEHSLGTEWTIGCKYTPKARLRKAAIEFLLWNTKVLSI